MVKNNTYYVTNIAIILILLFLCCFSTTSCSTKYTYSTIDTTAYSKEKQIQFPTAEEVELSHDSIATLDYISQNDSIITVNCTELKNFIIKDIHDRVFVFLSDAIVTINSPIRSHFSCVFASASENLYLNINNSISSGTTTPNLQEDLSSTSTIVANNLILIGSDAKIDSAHNCIEASTSTINCKNLICSSPETAIKTNTFNFYGGSTFIYSNIGVSCNQSYIEGGSLDIESSSHSIASNTTIINNGLMSLSGDTAIKCEFFTINNGYLTIFADFGVVSNQITINNGYFYANCKYICTKSIDNFNFYNGTAVLVAKSSNMSAIDAETADFNVYNGTLITNSTYAYSPSSNALFFEAFANNMIILKNSTNKLVYIPEVNGSIMIAGKIDYSFYSNNGKLTSHKDNFFGLLFNANVNTYSSKYINSTHNNYGAEIYNDKTSSNGQLLF